MHKIPRKSTKRKPPNGLKNPPDKNDEIEAHRQKHPKTISGITRAPRPPSLLRYGSRLIEPPTFRPLGQFDYEDEFKSYSAQVILAELDAEGMDQIAGVTHVMRAYIGGVRELGITGTWSVDEAQAEIERFLRHVAIHQGSTQGIWSEPSAELKTALRTMAEYNGALRAIAKAQVARKVAFNAPSSDAPSATKTPERSEPAPSPAVATAAPEPPPAPTASAARAADGNQRRAGRPRSKDNLHPEVERYLEKVSRVAQKLITIQHFCLVSGCRDDTIFGWWRRGDRRSTGAHANLFERTLKLTPEEFLDRLAHQKTDFH